jgi:hypothetical protein
MISTTKRLGRAGLVLSIAALGLAARVDRACGQYRADPYRPDSAQYDAFVFPIVPNNLGLPGAAREAAEYNSIGGGSRYNTFDRFLLENDLDSPPATRRRPPVGAGVPYYEYIERRESARGRNYAPNREADRRIAEYEDKQANLEARRNQLYGKALREKDPTKKAAILREYRDLAKVSDLRSQPFSASREPAAPRTTAPARMLPAIPRSDAVDTDPVPPVMAPATVPNTGTGTNAARSRTPATTPSTPTRRSRPEDLLPESRPLLPSERLEREERQRRTRPAPAPAPAQTPASDATAPVPSPVPSPDSTTPPR